MWPADAGLQQWSWGEVDSDNTTQDVYLSQFSSQTNNPLWHRQGGGGGLAKPNGHSPASRAQGSREKPACPTLHRGLESTPGEPCRATPWRVLASKQS